MPRHVSQIVFLMIIFCTQSFLDGKTADAKRSQPLLIGALTMSWGPTPTIVGLRDSLIKLGYVEDEDFVIGVRFTQGKLDALPAAVKELLQLGVGLLFVEDIKAAQAAQQATTHIPIIFAGGGDPVDLALAKALPTPAAI